MRKSSSFNAASSAIIGFISMRLRHRIPVLLAATVLGTLTSCSMPGLSGDRTTSFVNGEIIHTTPDAWPQAAAKLPQAGSSAKPSEALEARVKKLAAKTRRPYEASPKLIGIEIQLIESSCQPQKDDATSSHPRILSKAEVTELVQHLRLGDSRRQSTTFPRMATFAGKPVALRSVVNQPILTGSRSEITPAGGRTTANIGYLPVGTSLLLCPVVTAKGHVHIEADFSLSRIVGKEMSAGSPYPVVTAWFHQPGFDLLPGEGALIPGPRDEAGRQTDILVTASESTEI